MIVFACLWLGSLLLYRLGVIGGGTPGFSFLPLPGNTPTVPPTATVSPLIAAGISLGHPTQVPALTQQQALLIASQRAGELLLRSDPGLAAELAADRLAPLWRLSHGARLRFTETLRAWLEEQGRLGQVASRLGVHPQTARYRIARLRELAAEAGFSTVRRVPMDNPFNSLYELTP